MKSNKKLIISSGVIGTFLALAHIGLVIGLICYLILGDTDLSEYGLAGIVVAIFVALAKVLAIGAIIISFFAGIYLLISSMVTTFAKKDKARRVFAILNCILLSFETLIEVIALFMLIASVSSGVSFLWVLAVLAALAVTVSCFALNIILAKKPKKVEEN